MKTGSVLRAALALVAATALAAGCGVTNPFSPPPRASAQDQLLRWSECMRQHGINEPDPVNGAIRVTVTPGPGGGLAPDAPTEENPRFPTAQNACRQYAPNGGQGSRPPSQQQLDQATRFAQCMRDHGIPMEDPTVQNGDITMQGGDINGPNVDPDSQQFQQAQQACAKYLPSGR